MLADEQINVIYLFNSIELSLIKLIKIRFIKINKLLKLQLGK